MSATTDQAVPEKDRGHDNCVLCGTENPRSLGLVFRADSDGVTRAEFQGNPELQGYEGLLHGGIVASLLDSAMTNCLFHAGVRALTAELRVRYVDSVPCEAAVGLSAWITGRSPRLFKLRAELAVGDSVLAWAEAKFLRIAESS